MFNRRNNTGRINSVIMYLSIALILSGVVYGIRLGLDSGISVSYMTKIQFIVTIAPSFLLSAPGIILLMVYQARKGRS